MTQKFPRTYNDTDFGITADVVCTASKWNKIGSVKVPAQQTIAFGGGAIANGVDSRETGTLSFDESDSTQITGVIRLAISNANETDIRIIKEDRTENWDDGVKLAETGLKAKEDSKLIIFFKPDSTKTIAQATSLVVLLPVTVYQ